MKNNRMNDYSTIHKKHKVKANKALPILLGSALVVILAIVLLSSGLFGSPSINATGTPSPGYTAGLTTASMQATPSPTSSAATSTIPTQTPYSGEQIQIKMVGDILLHGSTRGSALQDDGTFNFDPYFDVIKDNLQGDLVIANIESPIDAFGNGSGYSSYPRFNIPRAIIPALKKIGVNLALTANNHALDKGFSGLVNTKKALRELGLDSYGTYESKEEYNTWKIINVKEIKVGILSYTDSTNGLLSTVDSANRNTCIRAISLSSASDLAKMVSEVKAIREAGAEFVIVTLHWGREYADAPTERQRAIAQELIDAGADVLMGNHSHCVQPVVKKTVTVDGKEKTALVAYSLGNFLADQMPLGKPENLTQHSMILNVTAQRDPKTGAVTLLDASYTPTFIHRDTINSSKLLYKYKVLPAGKYALADTRPEIFESDQKWQLCKQAWERVQRIAGNAIPAEKG